VRYVLSALIILAGLLFLLVGVPIIARRGILWLGLTALGLGGVNVLLWYLIVRPYKVREDRREKGLCLGCGYDRRGNVSAVCPECGRNQCDDERLDD
jgi:hypothetical protein